jgi:hypothetical protein
MLQLNKFTTDKLVDLLRDTCSKESFYWTQRRFTLPPAAGSGAQDDDFVRSNERDEMIAYMLEICEREDMAFSVDTFSLTVSLVDRFLSNYKVKSKYLECLAIACLYIACKVKEEDENVSVTSEFLLDCDCKCSISELLRMEQMILTKFEWSVNDTTAVDFLNIYYGLLVNQYNTYSEMNNASSSNNNKVSFDSNNANIWTARNNAATAAFNDDVTAKPVMSQAATNAYSCLSTPPCDLDFLHELEYKLKQCLCVNKLTANFKPHQLAYTLLSIQMEKSVASISSRSMRDNLEKMMETIRQMCKLSSDTLERCKERVKYHLLSIENTKCLFDRYFKESSVSYRMLRDYKPSSLFIPQLSAIANQLDAIQEEDEEEFVSEQEDDDDDTDSCCGGKGVASNIYYGKGSLLEQQQDQDMANSYYEMQMHQDCMSHVVPEDQSISYADILMGRRDQKRKLSENSMSESELDYDSLMM